jgi:hypothetical protein
VAVGGRGVSFRRGAGGAWCHFLLCVRSYALLNILSSTLSALSRETTFGKKSARRKKLRKVYGGESWHSARSIIKALCVFLGVQIFSWAVRRIHWFCVAAKHWPLKARRRQ